MELPSAAIFDVMTLLVGTLIATIKAIFRFRRGIRRAFTPGYFVEDFLNGCVLLPFLSLIGAAFFSPLRVFLLTASPVTFALAGAVGLLFVTNELFRITRKFSSTRMPSHD